MQTVFNSATPAKQHGDESAAKIKMARYSRPETMGADGSFGSLSHGVRIDTPATRCATAIAKDIYRLANQAGIAPLELAQRITDAINECIDNQNARKSES